MSFPRLKRLSLIALALRCAAGLIQQWPWIVLVLCIVAPPAGPHLRWEYTYTPYGNTRIYRECHYLGLRGIVRYARTGNCPMIIWIADDE